MFTGWQQRGKSQFHRLVSKTHILLPDCLKQQKLPVVLSAVSGSRADACFWFRFGSERHNSRREHSDGEEAADGRAGGGVRGQALVKEGRGGAAHSVLLLVILIPFIVHVPLPLLSLGSRRILV